MSDEQTLTRDLWPKTWQWYNLVDGVEDAGLRHLVAQHDHVRRRPARSLTLVSSFPVAYALARFQVPRPQPAR